MYCNHNITWSSFTRFKSEQKQRRYEQKLKLEGKNICLKKKQPQETVGGKKDRQKKLKNRKRIVIIPLMNNKNESQGTETYKLNIESLFKNSSKLYCIVHFDKLNSQLFIN